MTGKMLCDGCDKVKHVKSYDGRTLVCFTCRIRYILFYSWRKAN